jgi:tripartite-type tricarboxylate transporter receptor subunit TctC
MPAKAQTVEQFYTNKTISFLVAAGSGGSYDVYAHALAPYLRAHMPGNPLIIVKMTGGVGGGIVTTMELDKVAARDGTVIGMTQQTNVISQLVEPAAIGKYDVSKWRWIGLMAPARNILGVWHTAPAQSLEEAKSNTVIIGATGRASPTFSMPQTLNEILGTKFKIVLGYNGVNDLNLAMERGEIQGRGGSWISVVAQAPQYITEKKLKPLVVDGLTREPALPDVPTLIDLAKNEEQREALTLVSASSGFGRAIMAPPGTPEGRVSALRKAFDETMADPAFLAEAKKLNIPIESQPGTKLDVVAAQIMKSSPPAIALARKLLGSE